LVQAISVVEAGKMSSQVFGVGVLDKHGAGYFDPAQREEIHADLRRELRANGTTAVSSETLDKEISRFLDFGYTSDNNLDRLRRRVMRGPSDTARGDDAASVRTVGSMAYSQPPMRVWKGGTDTPVPQLFSISEGMKSKHDSVSGSRSPGVQSARGAPSEQDADWGCSPNSARQSMRTGDSQGNGCKWSTVAKLRAVQEATEANGKKAAIKAKQLMLKGYLDEQVEAKSAMHQNKVQETRQLRSMVDDDFRRLQDEDVQKKMRVQKQVGNLKNDREVQVVSARATREVTRQEALVVGQQLAKNANRALEMEKEAQFDKKNREKQLMTTLMVEWGEEKKEKMDKQNAEAVVERNRVLAMQEELRQEEEQKGIELKLRQAKKDEEFEKLALAEANARSEKKVKREARIKDENKSMEVVRKMADEAVQKDRLKDAQKKADRVKNVEFLFQQMEETQRKKKVATEARCEMLSNARTATNKHLEDERAKTGERRGKNVQHRLELEAQIASRIQAPQRRREDLMSTAEAFLNKGVVADAGALGLF